MEQKNPESSPFFSHWRYDGNAVQSRLKIGPKTPIYKKRLDDEVVEDWTRKHGHKAIVAFADHNPEIKVEIEQDGEKKTVTLPQWARDWEKSKTERYYGENPWVFRCVDIKARAFASIPWAIYQGEDPEAQALEGDDEVVGLLREVNPELNWHDLATSTSKDLDLYGKAFWWKVRTGGNPREDVTGKVKFLRRLNPATIKVIADENGISHFEQQIKHSPVKYARENVIYFKDYDPENDFGSISPLEAAEKAIKVDLTANEHLADFFENYAMPAYLMSSPDKLQDADIKRIAGQWSREFKGKGKRGKTAFLGSGFEPHNLSYPPKELALEGIREEAHKAICSAFGVPMTLAGAQEAANYATMDIQRRSLYTETIIPRSRYIQGVINAELLSEFEGERFFRFEPDRLEVMQENKLDKAKWVALLAEHRVIKPELLAVEMGYTEEDAPEPQPNPFLDTQSAPAEKAQSINIAPEGLKTLTALTKYRRKAKNRIKDERSPVCDFTSKYVPKGMVKAIMVDLEGAESLDEVDNIFEQYGLEPHAE